MTSLLETIVAETEKLGYRADAIQRDYEFSDVWAAGSATVRRAQLAVFTQTPPSYRSAAFGVATGQGRPPEAVVREHAALGAPLFFVIEQNLVSVWQVHAGGPPRLLDRRPPADLPELFAVNRQPWAPDAIHRAKSIGRFEPGVQLDFVDAGLMPAIEGEVHERLDRLLRDALASTLDALPKDGGRGIFRGIFRLLAAKILTDRQHQIAHSWNDADVSSVLNGIGSYYNLPRDTFDPASVASALSGAWSVLRAGMNVANVSADDLAFVYENTLVTPQARKAFGTHSTPRHVAEYVVSRLGLWRLDAKAASVFEPFTGAGVFLVSALRHMREAMPHDWDDKRRHDLLVERITGAEIDPFACEVATLSLILADYPNTNGWRIQQADLFRDGELERKLAGSDVVLCNPPFEKFDNAEQSAYPKAAAISGGKAEVVLELALRARPRALGFVLPRTFLLDRAYREQRRDVERQFREIELVSLPDRTFAVSQVETALLIARDPRDDRQSQTLRSSEVDDRDRGRFALTGLPSRTRIVTRSPPSTHDGDLWIAPLAPLWDRLRDLPRLGSLLEGHWGLRWKDEGQRRATKSAPGQDRQRGLMKASSIKQFYVGDPVWIDVAKSGLYAGGDLPWSAPKILCNAGRRGRGNWRLTAAVDQHGLVASQQFVGLWVRPGMQTDLDALAAILNGPLVNAYIADHSTEKRLRITTLLAAPLPSRLPVELGDLVRAYASAAKLPRVQEGSDEQLATLLDEIDVCVLRAYDLPPRLERALLASFKGAQRKLVHRWSSWQVDVSDPAFSLAEIRSGLLSKLSTDWIRQELKPVSNDEAAIAAKYLP